MVKITSPFWYQRMEGLWTSGIEHQWRMCEKTGRLQNFINAAKDEGEFEGRIYNDSDVYKLLEATLYAYVLTTSEDLESQIVQVVDLIRDAQWEDGYIGNAFSLKYKGKRYSALASAHELYCMGHLLEACSVAYESQTFPKLIEIGKKLVCHLKKEFGLGGKDGYCGHQELELALVRWSHASGDLECLELARKMTDLRGHQPSPLQIQFDLKDSADLLKNYRPLVFKGDQYVGEYYQDDLPLRQQTKAVGHSVRAMYQFCGALDCYPGDQELIVALEKIWDNMVSRRMYITGGIGSAARNEGFTEDYDLPNYVAYCESCAGIGLAMWASRMAKTTGNVDYMETFERVVVNNILSGISGESCLYHYVNPLASNGNHRREEWFDCACCPPNLARFILSLERYVVWVNEPESELVFGLLMGMEGSKMGIDFKVESGWPFEGNYEISGENSNNHNVCIRFRQWGTTWQTLEVPPGPFRLSGSQPFEAKWVRSHPNIAENVGRIALMFGPIVYCLEEADLGAPVTHFKAELKSPTPVLTHEWWKLNFVVNGKCLTSDPSLYFSETPDSQPRQAQFIPYFAWNNRAPGSMQVWVAEA